MPWSAWEPRARGSRRSRAGLGGPLSRVPATRAIGFPDPVLDGDLLSRAWRTASDGWVVRLTETPLDLDNPSPRTDS
ncbi:DUF5953 family protein [Hyalangium versicolor]|uniref:DUF5953 family protein n=1 Tax=Hyalangium versicolor TaxID=2861190 RepID=UPI001CCB12F9|nr:DUF5953 family protein [Hyalangium versicolor]